MLDTTEIVMFAAVGLAFAAGLIVLARWAKQSVLRFAAYALIAISFLYVGFAFTAENASTWVGFEMTGVAVFGSLALLSIMHSPWFLAAGFALHPAWALAVHYFGAGAAFAPRPFALANTSFDVALALCVIFLAWRARVAKKDEAAKAGAAGKAQRSRAR